MKSMNIKAPSRSSNYRAPTVSLGRSQVDLSRSHKTSFDAGRLIPYFCEEVVPGDTFDVDATLFARVWSPLAAPIMDDIQWDLDFFYVPNRIIWDNWHAFLGEHDAAGAQDTTYVPPDLASATIVENSLAHYFGIPIGLVTNDEDVNGLAFRGFFKIYDEWYRDQNLIDTFSLASDDSAVASARTNSVPPLSAKKHDYFTSALPYLQKGSAQNAALTGTVAVATNALDNVELGVYQTGDGGWRTLDIGTGSALEIEGTASSGYLFADFDQALPGNSVGGISLNNLREAAAIQRLLELNARAGTRPNELIRAVFGVDVPDYRVDRPEYLGGGTGYINASPVANTTGIDSLNDPAAADRYPGELAGTAAGTLRAKFSKSFVEHGYVFGIMRARGQLSYSQGLDRKWSRFDKYDYLWPQMANLGEQPIYNKELYIEGDATDDDVFGYQERYADYRFAKSLITGQFDPAHSVSLDIWHLSEEFGSQPALNQTFIEDATPMARVTVVDSQHDFIVDGRVNCHVARVLPVKPVPSLMPVRF